MNLKELPVTEKKVLVRVDFNVPLNDKGEITDDTRIRAALPTIEYLLKQKASVILMSHMGRPKGQRDPKFSLKPCADRLCQLLHLPVKMAPDCMGKEVEEMCSSLCPTEIILLENLRFYEAEENPDKDTSFAQNLAKLGDFYVNDAFGTAHRAHSSTTTIAQYFPNKRAAGFLLEKEIDFLGKHFTQPPHPFYAIIGGAKVSSKLGVLKSLLSKVDALFIGGGMAYTFLKAQGLEIGDSLFETELLKTAKEFLDEAKGKNIPIFLPQDIVVTKEFANTSESQVAATQGGIPQGWQGMDIGPRTRQDWSDRLKSGQMIFWNGPVGVFEFPKFAKGTEAIAKCLADMKAITIIGGGDSVAAVNQLGLDEKFTHISTGGGATLEYIEFGHLPGIDALYTQNT